MSAEFGSLAIGLAHEIRNRLNTIRFNLINLQDSLGGNNAGGVMGPLVGDISGEVDRLERVLREFVRLARPERPRIEPVDVAELLEDVVQRAEGPCRSQNIEVSWDCPPAMAAAADPGQLQQVLGQLVLNARQAMPRGGRIHSSGSLRSGEAVMTVADTGPGIPEDVRGRIFQPFFSTRDEGIGLGLCVCRTLVEQMNGCLECQTEIGRGTTFVVRLPLVPTLAGDDRDLR